MNTTTNAPITTNIVTTTKAPTTTTSADETTVTEITETTVSEVTESTVTERFPTETTPRDPIGGGICEPANVVHETSWTKGKRCNSVNNQKMIAYPLLMNFK